MFHSQSDIGEKILTGTALFLASTVNPETDQTRQEFSKLTRSLVTIIPMIGCHTAVSTTGSVEYRVRIPLIRDGRSAAVISELTQSKLTFVEKIET
jgi:hypothetical protein